MEKLRQIDDIAGFIKASASFNGDYQQAYDIAKGLVSAGYGDKYRFEIKLKVPIGLNSHGDIEIQPVKYD